MKPTIWIGSLLASIGALGILAVGLVTAQFAIYGVKGGGTWTTASAEARWFALVLPVAASIPLFLWARLKIVLVQAKPVSKALLRLCWGTAALASLGWLSMAKLLLTDPDITPIALPLLGYPIGKAMMLCARPKET